MGRNFPRVSVHVTISIMMPKMTRNRILNFGVWEKLKIDFQNWVIIESVTFLVLPFSADWDAAQKNYVKVYVSLFVFVCFHTVQAELQFTQFYGIFVFQLSQPLIQRGLSLFNNFKMSGRMSKKQRRSLF